MLYYPAIPDFTDCSTYDSPDPSYGTTVQACGNGDLYTNMQFFDIESYFDSGALLPSQSDWTLPPNATYVEPCTQYVPPPLVLYTKTAIGTIVLITLVLGALGTFLFFKYVFCWMRPLSYLYRTDPHSTLSFSLFLTLSHSRYARNDFIEEEDEGEDEGEARAQAMAELQQEILAGEIEFVSCPVKEEAGPSRGLLGAQSPTTPR